MADEAYELSRLFCNTIVGRKVKEFIYPMLVRGVANRSGLTRLNDPLLNLTFVGYIPLKGKWQEREYLGWDIIHTPNFLGYRNYGDGAVLVSKVAERSYRWGFNTGHLGLQTYSYSSKEFSEHLAVKSERIELSDPLSFRDAVIPIINPKFDSAKEAIRRMNRGHRARAVSPRILLRAGNRSIVVIYRSKTIGVMSKGTDVELKPWAGCFKEELSSHGFSIR